MLLANFNLAIMCVVHATPLRIIMRAISEINFGDLVKKNGPIRQIKIPEKVSGYTVFPDT